MIPYVSAGAVVLAVGAVACGLQNVRCQPEVTERDCTFAAQAAVAAAPLGLGSVAAVEVCSVDLATLCALHDRPTDVILTLGDGLLVGVAVRREGDGRIEASAYWDEDGRIN